MAHVIDNLKLPSIDELFSRTDRENDKDIYEIDLNELHEFEGHCFRVVEDEAMQLLTESIRDIGVQQPAMARKRVKGGYELIEGHRRKKACELAGLKTMPVRVVEMDDETATVYMAASNLTQRKEFLFSEKAWAYRKISDALKHQGKKGKRTIYSISEESGDSESTVKRLIRLTYLIPELLEYVDEKKLALDQGKNLSYLNVTEQKRVLDVMQEGNVSVSAAQAAELRNRSETSGLTRGDVIEILMMPAKKKKRGFTMKQESIDRFFTPDYSDNEIEEIIISLLEQWKGAELNG